MDINEIMEAAKLLADARASGVLLDALPEALSPKNASEAVAIQLKTVARLHDSVAGWKVALSKDYELLYGALLRSRMFADGAVIGSDDLAMVGIEAEIAFRFDHPLPPRDHPYEGYEVAEAVTACPAIEVLDSRFRDYHQTSQIDRAADFMSNSAFVMGTPRRDWRSFDLSRLEARLVVDGVEMVRQIAGHAAGDPLIPALALVDRLRRSNGIPAGHVVTTGTYTGLQFVEKTSTIEAAFVGFGDVRCRFATGRP